MTPSLAWCKAADEAVGHVATLEGKTVRITFEAAFYESGFMRGRGPGEEKTLG
jgi:hypothetical protein